MKTPAREVLRKNPLRHLEIVDPEPSMTAKSSQNARTGLEEYQEGGVGEPDPEIQWRNMKRILNSPGTEEGFLEPLQQLALKKEIE